MRRGLLTLGLILAAALCSPAQGQLSLDVAKITCYQYVHSKITVPNYIVVWLSGYYNAKQNNKVIDPEDIQDKASKLQNYCYDEKNFKVPVMKAVEELFGKGKGKR